MASSRVVPLMRALWLQFGRSGRAATRFIIGAKGSRDARLMRLLAAALWLCATVLPAAAQLPDCAPGQLSDYEKLSSQGCSVGNYAFSNFRYQRGTDGLPSSSISVTAGIAPGSDDPGLLFEGSWAGTSRQGSLSTVSYDVSLLPKGKPIAAATLQMQFGQAEGTGEAKVVTEICSSAVRSGACVAPELKLQVRLAAGQGNKVSDSGLLKNPMSQLHVSSTWSTVTGKDGAASFNGFMTVSHASQTEANNGQAGTAH
jgi:hypothetical protein